MNREEAKELLPIIQAYAEGKEMQLKNNGVWLDAKYYIQFDKITSDEIRIKPEPKCRPFKDADECWNEMLKHQPFGWVKGEFGEYATIDFIDECGTARHGKATWNFKKSFDEVIFADGTPFGIKEGGEE